MCVRHLVHCGGQDRLHRRRRGRAARRAAQPVDRVQRLVARRQQLLRRTRGQDAAQLRLPPPLLRILPPRTHTHTQGRERNRRDINVDRCLEVGRGRERYGYREGGMERERMEVVRQRWEGQG